MFQRGTFAGVIDSTGAGWVQIFHLYRGSTRRYSYAGDYVKAAVKTMLKYPRRIRGRRYRPLRPGFIVRGFCVLLPSWQRFLDDSRIRHTGSKITLLRKKGLLRSKHLHAPLPRTVKRRQWRAIFPHLI